MICLTNLLTSFCMIQTLALRYVQSQKIMKKWIFCSCLILLSFTYFNKMKIISTGRKKWCTRWCDLLLEWKVTLPKLKVSYIRVTTPYLLKRGTTWNHLKPADTTQKLPETTWNQPYCSIFLLKVSYCQSWSVFWANLVPKNEVLQID